MSEKEIVMEIKPSFVKKMEEWERLLANYHDLEEENHESVQKT